MWLLFLIVPPSCAIWIYWQPCACGPGARYCPTWGGSTPIWIYSNLFHICRSMYQPLFTKCLCRSEHLYLSAWVREAANLCANSKSCRYTCLNPHAIIRNFITCTQLLMSSSWYNSTEHTMFIPCTYPICASTRA